MSKTHLGLYEGRVAFGASVIRQSSASSTGDEKLLHFNFPLNYYADPNGLPVSPGVPAFPLHFGKAPRLQIR